MTTLTPPDFAFVADLVRRESAIVLEPGKEYLVESRLSTVVRQAELSDISALVAKLRQERTNSPLAKRVVDAMTTNETLFFRDGAPFVALTDHVLPTYADEDRTLRVWSAACSSGQEAYSIAMTIAEVLPDRLEPGRTEILATDISETMLERTRAGIYSQIEVNRGLPAHKLMKWMHREGMTWEVDPVLRRMVRARLLNLAQPWSYMPQQHLIFLRNVLIYFDDATKRGILQRARELLVPGGYLFLGAGEDATMIDPGWERVSLGAARAFQAAA